MRSLDRVWIRRTKVSVCLELVLLQSRRCCVFITPTAASVLEYCGQFSRIQHLDCHDKRGIKTLKL
jgi:hypothetical protein